MFLDEEPPYFPAPDPRSDPFLRAFKPRDPTPPSEPAKQAVLRKEASWLNRSVLALAGAAQADRSLAPEHLTKWHGCFYYSKWRPRSDPKTKSWPQAALDHA